MQFTPATARIGGSVTELTDAEEAAVACRLSLSQGALNRAGELFSDATLTFAVLGTLTDPASCSLRIDTRVEGDFLTVAYSALGDEVPGGVTLARKTQRISGGFIAKR